MQEVHATSTSQSMSPTLGGPAETQQGYVAPQRLRCHIAPELQGHAGAQSALQCVAASFGCGGMAECGVSRWYLACMEGLYRGEWMCKCG